MTTNKNQAEAPTTQSRCYCHACMCGDGFCIRGPQAFYGTPKKLVEVPAAVPAATTQAAPVSVQSQCYCHFCMCGDGSCIRQPRVFYGTPKKRKSSRKVASR